MEQVIGTKVTRVTGAFSHLHNWRFEETGRTRDPRLDFMRGFVFVILFTCHFEYFSLFMFIGWERLGIISSAETFIALAGVVAGLVYKKKLKTEGWAACTQSLVKRAIDIYKINVIVVLSAGLLRLLPWLDTTALTTFYDPYSGTRYQLYPPIEAGFSKLLRDSLLLQCGPHQFQVMGLYAVLFTLSPAIFYLLLKKRAFAASAISWTAYLLNFMAPESNVGVAEIRLTGAQFEFAFPCVAWQLLFVHSIIAGYYKQEIVEFFTKNAWLVWIAAYMALAFMLLALNHRVDSFPEWAQLRWIPEDQFNAIYKGYFAKYNLGPARVLNEIVFLITVYAVLTRIWKPMNKLLGWFFIPLGEASLYVFAIHIPLLLLVANSPLPSYNNLAVNTIIHAGALGLAWLAVKKQFLFKWVPH